MNSNRCGNCGLVNFASEESCKRCGNALPACSPPPGVSSGAALPAQDGTGSARNQDLLKGVVIVVVVAGALAALKYLLVGGYVRYGFIGSLLLMGVRLAARRFSDG